MATRLQTLEYWFSNIATLADASASSATQITVTLPAGTKTFRKVVAEAVVSDSATTVASVTQRQIEIQLASAGYSAVNNTQTLANGGENFSYAWTADFTSYFTTNWTGTAMTCDCRVTINTSTAGSRNCSVRLLITLEFEDTEATHVKTVWIPLNAPVGALATTKPGTATDTIPALDTYCPENGKTFLQTVVVLQGNTEGNGAVDKSISFEIDTNGVFTSGLIELGTTVDVWHRQSSVQSFTTNAEHDFFLWGSTADFDHTQAYLVVTYSFTPSGTTSILNSLQLPMEFSGGFGGTTSGDYQRGERELWIQEPATITTQRVALLLYWNQATAISGLQMRIGTGSFVAYTSVATVLGGVCGAMIRNDSAFTLARGRNTLNCDVYSTDTADLGYNSAGVWLVNYTSGVPTNGIWAANHTVEWPLYVLGTAASAAQVIVAATAPVIPEASYFLTSIGVKHIYTSNGTGNPMGVHVGVERLASGEGGMMWEGVYEAFGGADPESGIYIAYSTARSIFNRWPGDDASRLDIETARRWRIQIGGACAGHNYLAMLMTYHSITFTAADSISGFTGTVDLHLHREASGEKVLTSSRSGDGAFSFTWYDNTEELFVTADDGTNVGRSAATLAS